MTITRTSLAVHPTPALRVADDGRDRGIALLDPDGPFAILGGERGADGFPTAIRPAAHTLFGPRGLCPTAAHGPFWVADTGHHRLLGWRTVPRADATAADCIIGQPDFTGESRNAGGEARARSLDVSTGMARCGAGLAVADAGNLHTGAAAHAVAGQAGFQDKGDNQWHAPGRSTLSWPYGLRVVGDSVAIADSGNSRIVLWRLAL